MTKPTVVIAIGQEHYARMFSQAAFDALAEFANVVHHEGQEPTTKEELIALLPDADAVITSWGVATLDADVMNAAPNLKAMAHMGSSVKRFVSDAFWERGMHLTSAGITLARDVAETTLGLMIVGQKRIWPLGQHVREGGWRDSPAWDKWFSRELFRKEVGIIGASNVGRYVIELLKPFDAKVLLYDPFVSEEEAAKLGVEKLELDELLRRSDVVSLHAPANEHTYQMLNAEGLVSMKDEALIVNTGRGTLIDEPALIKELQKGRFFAFLDVTDPEPPAADSPLRTLDNVVVTPHIAGCIENCNRMGELAVEELRRFFAKEEAVYKITPELFERIS
ncbi:MAG: hydroxyacid dehydrogenase [Anaerolineae bacterium]|jgi:phosphoglycerate dehydrogenase-like enzyme|nr:hydroxyacid dehydrogenase [Anaerolineae bacterium]MBT4459837.1 hydroxyacid dehydrogenase [Anaerolineae bacterium]MBT6060687.1 hydroxyacid dehydrogenase [Anaerolineae bacterium]MBT6321211.1 hydroxyacid dehydrogenase [Anaerolineae bacterium]MBT6814295.1 hydroxyacid dehydrogenase [Anaerolineae bacterium]